MARNTPTTTAITMTAICHPGRLPPLPACADCVCPAACSSAGEGIAAPLCWPCIGEGLPAVGGWEELPEASTGEGLPWPPCKAKCWSSGAGLDAAGVLVRPWQATRLWLPVLPIHLVKQAATAYVKAHLHMQ